MRIDDLTGRRIASGSVRQFDFPNLKRVVYGQEALGELGAEVRRLHGTRVLLITSRSTAANSELTRLVRSSLGSLLVAEFRDAAAHVPLATVRVATAMAREAGADLVVSLGGGSPIDCGKAVALCAPSTESVEVTLARTVVDTGVTAVGDIEHAPLPQVTISTTLSAAEFTPTFTVTSEIARAKIMYHDPRVTPSTVILDPFAAKGTPSWLWAASGVRAIDHCVEWYLSAARTPFTDALAISALQMLWRALPTAVNDPDDLDARQECQLAAWMSVYGSSNVLGGLSHAIGHQLGSNTGMPHGYTSCVILPHVIEFNAHAVGDRVAALAGAVGLPDDDLANGLRRLLDGLGMPSTISQATDSVPDLSAIAEATMMEVAIVNNPREVTIEDVQRILEQAH
ncbi:iron-containing alcohol dehydrogenase [Salinibacterium sp. TMP30]|uniref:iron-containing alcohol dehydrogenase n=1 Tax=Salinibacterium sp. TMP30 TaxID=3138237 RepID=UPI003138FBF2